MKIYIVNILPESLKNKLKNVFESFEYIEKIKYELHSKEFGLHILEDDKIYLKESTFKTDYELIKGYQNLDLLLDKTNLEHNKLIPVVSQLPVNYITTKYNVFEFKQYKKSNLSLIIECIEENDKFEKNMIPINFYFNYTFRDCKETINIDLKEPFFQDEFNVFLSKLI
jgi:hypothetical protein